MSSILLLFVSFFMIGLFTFGGGYAMIPMIIEKVTEHNWMTVDELYSFIGVAEATPGPFAVNTATFVGFNQAGFFGALASTSGVVLPSFIIIVLIASLGDKFIKSRFFQMMLKGVRPVVIGLIVSVTIGMLYENFFGSDFDIYNLNFSYIDYRAMIIFGVSLILSFIRIRTKNKYFKFTPIMLILISGVLGIILYLL